jgi:hypothetical protein
MWDLQGILLYRSIEHRDEARRQQADRVRDDALIPYAHLLSDPRFDTEEAKKIAA